MKVVLLKDCKHGKAGAEVSGQSAFRLCLPVRGMVAKPADKEALAAVEWEISTTSGATRSRLLKQLADAGVYPVELTQPEKPKAAPVPASTTAPVQSINNSKK